MRVLQSKIDYLGHVIGKEGIRPDPKKTNVIMEMDKPTDVSDLRSFLGIANYYRKFIPGYTEIAHPPFKLLEKDSEFAWDDTVHTPAMDKLKEHLTSEPLSIYPDFDKPFWLYTDASNYGVGAVLSQKIDGEERPIAYYSKSPNKHEKNYATTAKERLAVVRALVYFRPYIASSKIYVVTDHTALEWLLTTKHVRSKFARWIFMIQEYDYEILSRPGKIHGNADALSRRPVIEECDEVNRIAVRHDKKEQLSSFAKMQRRDPYCNKIIKYLQTGTIDGNEHVEKTIISISRFMWIDEEGQLVHIWLPQVPRVTKHVEQLVVPLRKIGDVLRRFHDDEGHVGFDNGALEHRRVIVVQEVAVVGVGEHHGVANVPGAVQGGDLLVELDDVAGSGRRVGREVVVDAAEVRAHAGAVGGAHLALRRAGGVEGIDVDVAVHEVLAGARRCVGHRGRGVEEHE